VTTETHAPLADTISARSSSTNAVRPTLPAPRQHAIHAYLHAGSTASHQNLGVSFARTTRSARPPYEDVDERLRTIALPVGVSLAQASDTKHVARALTTRPDFNNEQRWSWQRAEKPRKLAWMITTGLWHQHCCTPTRSLPLPTKTSPLGRSPACLACLRRTASSSTSLQRSAGCLVWTVHSTSFSCPSSSNSSASAASTGSRTSAGRCSRL
jgi:hypothetical protein